MAEDRAVIIRQREKWNRAEQGIDRAEIVEQHARQRPARQADDDDRNAGDEGKSTNGGHWRQEIVYRVRQPPFEDYTSSYGDRRTMTLMSPLVVSIGDLYEERTTAIRHYGCSALARWRGKHPFDSLFLHQRKKAHLLFAGEVGFVFGGRYTLLPLCDLVQPFRCHSTYCGIGFSSPSFVPH